MFIGDNLIRNEYFPVELPPCFYSEMAADNYDKIKGWTSGVKRNQSIPLTYSGFKSENSRRKFAIPNIYHYFKAVNCIEINSEEILSIMEGSKISLSKPLKGTPPIDKPYKKKTYSIRETKDIIEEMYQDNLYEIKLDISSFFDNIYTHTIPWAMHTKKVSKKSDKKSLTGDKLDKCVRAMNHDQTNGILVGNAVSRIISEIILCTIDKEIQKQFKSIKCCRFVDDYYIYIKNSSQIQNIISFIRTELGKYELMLNENKIQVKESPFIYGKPWVEEIKLFIHLNSEVFLNKIISLYIEYKDISILRYGLTVLSLHNLSKKEWIGMESKILNLWVKFPSLSDLIIKILLEKSKLIKKSNLKNAIYAIFTRCIPLNQHQEVIWAVWIAKNFKVQIRQEYIIKIIESENVLAIIILLDIINSGNYYKLRGVKSSISDLREILKNYDIDENEENNDKKNGNLLWSQYWLLAYEADLNKWLDTEEDEFKYARNDDFFKNLIKHKIRFYDVDFNYEENLSQQKSIRYITSDEFFKYIEKVTELLNKLTDLKKDINDINELSDISSNFIHRIEEQISTY